MRYIIILVLLLAGCGSGGNSSNEQSASSTPSTPSMPLTILPQTGQTVCYESPLFTTVTPCAGTGQDGETQAGASWPSPRFTSDTIGIARDELTGLEWTTNRNAPGPAACSPLEKKTWEDALDYIDCINQQSYLGHNDWHLPNVVELSSLFYADRASSFSEQIESGAWGYWWTSTTAEDDTTQAFASLAEGGYISSKGKSEILKAWPVRTGETGKIVLHRTGQVACYDALGNVIDCAGTGQDGDVLAGREWPDPRFTDNGDETISDNLTGVVWTKNTNFPFSETCSSGPTDFPSSVEYIKCLNDNAYLGHNDWRLPNEFELRSLDNYNIASDETSNWLSDYGFYNFAYFHVLAWSSTLEDYYGAPIGVWVGGGNWSFDFAHGHVWPVRSINTYVD